MKDITVMDFSGIYEDEYFYRDKNIHWIDGTHIVSSNGYVSDEAKRIIKEKIKNRSVHGIHFIDNGNYHYLTELWIEKIKEPFVLVVFDHHSDMQESLFSNLISCGSWIMNAYNHPCLKKVILIGISHDQRLSIDSKYTHIECIEEKELLEDDLFLINMCESLPIYISIDKDVLSKQELNTTWDQGVMTLSILKYYLQLLKRTNIIGIDICGDCRDDIRYLYDMKRDDYINSLLLKWLE